MGVILERVLEMEEVSSEECGGEGECVTECGEELDGLELERKWMDIKKRS